MVASNNILVVDDDEGICNMLGHYLGNEGFAVTAAYTGKEMRQAIAASNPDLIILDLMLPDADGMSLAKEVRSSSAIPIIMLTGKDDPVEKVVGLEIGADDYVTKPFNRRELLARIRSIMRRIGPTTTAQDSESTSDKEKFIATFYGWRLDMKTHELTSPAGNKVHLTHHEFQLLCIFTKSGGQIMGRDTLMIRITGRERNPGDRSIDILVRKLRKKIESNPSQPQLIKSIRSVGYQFTAEVEFKS